ncbi:hypothetical protein PS880_06308 [Pseudomonas fluorescens]|uniref:Uncharacterized protein n=1 Tax=Pseudomonas fluorescens TaxID=294 RepID=A0A5E7QGY9_PSEFL|nr:hypothetical protein PS880_06308 [Pseudomonas fluorescens]
MLAGHQTAETERLVPQLERLQIAQRGGVFAVARIGFVGAGMVIGLRIEGADAVLHAHVQIDESTADAPPVIEAKLRFAEAIAAQGELAFFNEVVAAQGRHPGVERGLAQRITVDHPLGAQLMGLAVTGLFEIKTVGLGQRAVLALAVAVTEIPPAPRQVVIQKGIVGGLLVITHGIVTAAQRQLIGQAQRAVPIEGRAPLLFASAFLPVVAA